MLYLKLTPSNTYLKKVLYLSKILHFMHTKIVKRIRQLRVEKDFSPIQMAEKLNIDLSAYKRLEAGKTLTWAKYLEELLIIFDSSIEDFFEGLGSSINVTNKKGSYLGNNGHVENLYSENKEKSEKLNEQYESRLKDKDSEIEFLKKIIESKLFV